jgi:GxxExxY protein
MTKKNLDDLSYRIIGAAIDVHKELGPGLLEKVYHKCLHRELLLLGLAVKHEQKMPVLYKGLSIGVSLRCDLVVNDLIAVETKAVQTILPLFKSQLLTYMRLLNIPKGILINFNCTNIFTEGQKTLVNDLYRNLPD